MVYENEICTITQPLKSTQTNYKLPHLMRRQRSYEAVNYRYIYKGQVI